jgi:hypothetical protein
MVLIQFGYNDGRERRLQLSTSIKIKTIRSETVMTTSVPQNQLKMRQRHHRDVGKTAMGWTNMHINRSVDRSDSE